MRPGRLDRILYVSPPDATARTEILRVNFRRMAINDDVDIDMLSEMASRLSASKHTSELTCRCRRKAALGRK